MLAKIKQFFDTQFAETEQDAPLSAHQRQLATAALLIEVATVDHEFSAQEFSALLVILKSQFELTDTELNELAELAKQESEQATSLYQFTQLVNAQFAPAEKYQLIKSMWQIAYADGNLDKYEEYVVRKVSELIYVAHSDFIRAKHQARAEIGKQ